MMSGLFLAFACGTSEPPLPTPPPPPTPPAASSVAVPAKSTSELPPPPPSPPLPAVELVEGEHGEAPAKMPTVKFKAPAQGQVISVDKKGDYEVKLDVKDWPAPEGGRHVHLIVDNQPYKRIDDPKQPVKLKDIVPGYELAENKQHILIAFASRSTHESVKALDKKGSPMAVVGIFIGKKDEERWKPKDPLLVYSRPKGKNDGPPPPEGLLVDFYLVNAELGEGKFSVKATLKGPGVEEGKTVIIKSWKPWRIKNPRDGSYSLQLTLLDREGKPVPGPWNDVTHSFQVNTRATSDASHHHGSSGEPESTPHK
ncbi:MAG: hypothetical protein NZX77_20490 [Polyangiaceae bacterium]|nr:hypothetical protein [Polyangiaceae bacterium]